MRRLFILSKCLSGYAPGLPGAFPMELKLFLICLFSSILFFLSCGPVGAVNTYCSLCRLAYFADGGSADTGCAIDSGDSSGGCSYQQWCSLAGNGLVYGHCCDCSMNGGSGEIGSGGGYTDNSGQSWCCTNPQMGWGATACLGATFSWISSIECIGGTYQPCDSVPSYSYCFIQVPCNGGVTTWGTCDWSCSPPGYPQIRYIPGHPDSNGRMLPGMYEPVCYQYLDNGGPSSSNWYEIGGGVINIFNGETRWDFSVRGHGSQESRDGVVLQ
jgi:hypothetical protein